MVDIRKSGLAMPYFGFIFVFLNCPAYGRIMNTVRSGLAMYLK